MIDITGKIKTHRAAIAQAIVKVSRQETMDAIYKNKIPKGDVFEVSRVAGLFAVKRTSDMIPDCHPLPIEYCHVRHEVKGLEILIKVEVQTIYRTGVEVEAMHGASVVALTIYDMLKPIDKEIEITGIKLLNKEGGKSQYAGKSAKIIHAGIIVCSDRISAGKREDIAGKEIMSKLGKIGVEVNMYCAVADKIEDIQKRVRSFCEEGLDLIVLTGGTGLSKRDVTPEAVRPLLDMEIPGIAEAIRNYGQERMPYSMLSRSVAGIRAKTIILALPGSARGAEESIDAIFPYLLHAFEVMSGKSHG